MGLGGPRYGGPIGTLRQSSRISCVLHLCSGCPCAGPWASGGSLSCPHRHPDLGVSCPQPPSQQPCHLPAGPSPLLFSLSFVVLCLPRRSRGSRDACFHAACCVQAKSELLFKRRCFFSSTMFAMPWGRRKSACAAPWTETLSCSPPGPGGQDCFPPHAALDHRPRPYLTASLGGV